jgi:alpha-beta hydrolase superfamily lysophospholipase
MRNILSAANAGLRAPTQMIWLPGAYHLARDFEREGFAHAVNQRRKPIDLQFVDLEMQHLNDQEALQRLHFQIIAPARASGRSVWLAGISLGGLIALDYASSHLDEIDGLCLLAPYLGNRMLINEIAAAGLAAWEPGELAETDAERRIWRYIKTRIQSRPLFLGYGRDDRFSRAHDLMAAALPAGSVEVIAGGHEWRTWTRLWENFLDSHFA